MTAQADLYRAIFDAVAAFASANSMPVKWPGKKLKTPDSGNWFELSINSNDIDPTLNDQTIYRRGMFQLNVGGKPDRDSTRLSAIADLIQAEFYKTKPIIDAVTVSDTPYQTSLIELDDRVILPVTINYSE